MTRQFAPRDKWSCLTHLFGTVLAAIGTVFLLCRNADAAPGRFLAMLVYGLSLIALYAGSARYHYSRGSAEHIETLRRIDHSMIFMLIAGTYTPTLYVCLPPLTARIFLTVLWLLAAAGVVMKIFWLYAPRWLYTLVYLIMGWSLVFDWPAFISLPLNFIISLLAGGAAYTIGAVIYARKKPNPSGQFGFHEIFHVFILIGSACHYCGIAFLI
ncbi:MAG: PAQR family membrane homeostasis protein TrhA [Anaerovoracaceae bacterium]|jgi:hemolysin III